MHRLFWVARALPPLLLAAIVLLALVGCGDSDY